MRGAAESRRGRILGLVFALGLAAVALVLVVQERVTDDLYAPGTLHDVTLVRQSPCSDVWVTTPDIDHEWQTDGAVPEGWTGDSVDGTLRVAVEWGESSVVVGDDAVNVFGGRLADDRGITVECGG